MKKNKQIQLIILFLGFLSIYLSIILNLFSINSSFFIFILVTIIFGLFKIDSRFLIFAALFHLWYAPFMLLLKQQAIAESTAVYAYYYLVTGVVLQFIEFKLKTKNTIDFEIIFKKLININYIVPSIIIIILLSYNYFFQIIDLITRNTYFYILSLTIFFALFKFIEPFEK